mgnify:CR=1 FL=1
MIKSTGHADLPLHSGTVPRWLADRMMQLGTLIVESLVLQYGKKEVLVRLSDPLWFQSLGAVLGMDWHSSGITTSVMYALKRGLNPRAHELGICICGGRGKYSRRTPEELLMLSERTSLDGEALVRSSKLCAKVDNTAVQDGFQLYQHNFILTDEGDWAVVQQGMNTLTKTARRYHWCSADIKSFVEEPHSAVTGENRGRILNLTDAQADGTRGSILALAREEPERVLKEIAKISGADLVRQGELFADDAAGSGYSAYAAGSAASGMGGTGSQNACASTYGSGSTDSAYRCDADSGNGCATSGMGGTGSRNADASTCGNDGMGSAYLCDADGSNGCAASGMGGTGYRNADASTYGNGSTDSAYSHSADSGTHGLSASLRAPAATSNWRDNIIIVENSRNLRMPAHHDVRDEDVDLKRLGAVLATAYADGDSTSAESHTKDFESLLLTPGLGARTLQSLTLVSEVIYGTPSRFRDPARFSFAHGGKDGHPFPVPTKIYDESIRVLGESIEKSKLGYAEKSECLKRLHRTALQIEANCEPEADFDATLAREKAHSREWGGRTCMGIVT